MKETPPMKLIKLIRTSEGHSTAVFGSTACEKQFIHTIVNSDLPRVQGYCDIVFLLKYMCIYIWDIAIMM